MVDQVTKEGTNLMRNVRSSITNVSVHLPHHANMLIAVQQRILVILHAIATIMHSLVRLKASVRQYDYKSLRVVVTTQNDMMLLSDQLREAGRR